MSFLLLLRICIFWDILRHLLTTNFFPKNKKASQKGLLFFRHRLIWIRFLRCIFYFFLPTTPVFLLQYVMEIIIFFSTATLKKIRLQNKVIVCIYFYILRCGRIKIFLKKSHNDVSKSSEIFSIKYTLKKNERVNLI